MVAGAQVSVEVTSELRPKEVPGAPSEQRSFIFFSVSSAPEHRVQ